MLHGKRTQRFSSKCMRAYQAPLTPFGHWHGTEFGARYLAGLVERAGAAR